MAFVLGDKGKEWAWKKGKWRSVEHFQKTQRDWSIAALVVVSLRLAFYIYIMALVVLGY